MLQKFLPDTHVKSIFEITPEFLKEHGIEGIITDLDNTLVEWDRPNATPKLEKWFEQMREHGIKVAVVSNNNQQRVEVFSKPLNIPFYHRAKKPSTKTFRQALLSLALEKDKICVIGDQLLTDIFGGNRLGVHTILVVPVAQTDGAWTKFNRKLERLILNKLRKKGLVHWEEV